MHARRSNRLRARSIAALSAAAFALYSAVASAENSAEINYMLNCQGCHLPGGVGHPGIVPNLRGEIGRFLHSQAGRAYLIQVPGAAQSTLNDADLAAVLNWMLASFDPARTASGFKPFVAAEIAKYRATAIIDISAKRANILQSARLQPGLD